MKKKLIIRYLAFWGMFCIVAAIPAYGRSVAHRSPCSSSVIGNPCRPLREPSWARHGRLTLGLQLGFGLENNIPHDISHINMVIAEPEIGVIAWDSPHSRLPIKRFGIISEGILGGSTHPGGDLFGTLLVFRFGFKPMGRVMPYLDAGSGPVHTTINANAPELTGDTQFLDQGGIGFQYFYKPQRALVLEYHYFHMSNGGLQQPNHGFNGSMVTIGFCWLSGLRPPLIGTSDRSRVYLPNHW